MAYYFVILLLFAVFPGPFNLGQSGPVPSRGDLWGGGQPAASFLPPRFFPAAGDKANCNHFEVINFLFHPCEMCSCTPHAHTILFISSVDHQLEGGWGHFDTFYLFFMFTFFKLRSPCIHISLSLGRKTDCESSGPC